MNDDCLPTSTIKRPSLLRLMTNVLKRSQKTLPKLRLSLKTSLAEHVECTPYVSLTMKVIAFCKLARQEAKKTTLKSDIRQLFRVV